MLKDTKKITLSGVELPIKMDNIVLQEIQEEYGTIKEFELLLKGIVEKEGEDGKITFIREKEPSITVINYVLPKMILEGMDIEGIERTYTEKDLIRMIDINHYKAAAIIEEEFERCFKIKK